METMYFSAASTLMSSTCTSSRGIIRKKPDVGFGVVGTYTLTKSLPSFSATSPLGAPVRKAIVHAPCRGYCTSRSEEHTSELQSLMRISYAVFCLKKNKQRT